ncbi:hypothetical protein M6B38_415030 [Iris pallida]|uniref:Uncharacterized protein n=1 Tax=Iris pallida TaxID=29817 RepID=A0AAX6FJS7_IRIPA|nr:hypothetical protein M6B38_415030 [Iris pallida]
MSLSPSIFAANTTLLFIYIIIITPFSPSPPP